MNRRDRIQFFAKALLFCLLHAAVVPVRAGDNAQLVSMTIASNTQIAPRTIFTQTWTIQNTGTTTWTPTDAGYTLNMTNLDTLGAIPLFALPSGTHPPSALIASGKSVPPGGTASFSMMFIAPEKGGTYTDTFQMNGTTNFGPVFTVQIVVVQAGSTNQYDRARAVSYANNYAAYVCRDGYFWTNGSYDPFFGTNFVPVPTAELGDDCAHFVSSCIGQYSALPGGGIYLPSRTAPCYGEPSAYRLATTCLIDCGYATEVSSISQMEPGDVIGWNWEGNTNLDALDHVTLYLGNDLTASHAISALDVSADTYFQTGEPNYVRHLIHIFDAPTLHTTVSNKTLTFSWTTNWSSYILQSSSSLAHGATWTKVSTTPTKSGISNFVSVTMGTGPVYYRLELP